MRNSAQLLYEVRIRRHANYRDCYFRVRLGCDESPSGFKAACFLGIDGNGDGKLDLFVGVNNSGGSDGIYIWKAGNGANISPSTTTIDSKNPVKSYAVTAANYSWVKVDSTIDPDANTAAKLNTDGRTGNSDQTDYFVNFSIPFADLVSAFQSVGVTAVNDPPVAADDTATTEEDTAVKITVLGNDKDADNDPLTVTSATVAPAQGSVTVNQDGTLAFTPAKDFNGTATITYSISDGKGGTSTAQVIVTVTAVNDPPVANDDSATTPEGRTVVIDVLENDSDAELTNLTVTKAVLYAGQGTVTVNPDGTVEVTPAPKFTGTAILIYTVQDGSGGTASATVRVTVDGLPIAVDDYASTPMNTSKLIDVLANDADPEGLPLTVAEALLDPAQGQVAIGPDGRLSFTPANGVAGLITIRYTVRDAAGNIATAKVLVTVGGTSSGVPPVAVADFATAQQQTAVSINVLANDQEPSGASLTIKSLQVDSAVGTATIGSNGAVVFTSALGFTGIAVVTYTIANPSGLTASAPVMITVLGGNVPPIASPDVATATPGVPKNIHVLSNDTDPDGDVLTVSAASVPPAQGTVTRNQDGTVTFTAAQDFLGVATITYQVTDGRGGFAANTVTVTVSESHVNGAPVAQNDTAATPVRTPVDAVVLANDNDPDGDVLTVTSVEVSPTQGAATVNADGSIHFVPAPEFNDSARIRYTVSDGNGGTDSAVLTITVNDNPVAVTDVTSTPVGVPKTIAVLVNDSDPNGNPLTITGAAIAPAEGAVVINPDGTITFTPAPAFHGTALISYTISDGKGGTAEGTALVSVNTPPVLTPDVGITTIDQPLTVSVLDNDTDPDEDTLTVIGATVDPLQGTVTVNADGTITFNPAPTFTGPATITYTVTDSNGEIRTSTVTVTRANAAPTSETRTVYTYCGTALQVNARRTAADIDGDTLTPPKAQ